MGGREISFVFVVCIVRVIDIYDVDISFLFYNVILCFVINVIGIIGGVRCLGLVWVLKGGF